MPSDIERAAQIVSELQAKRDALVSRRVELGEERTVLAFGAFTGDDKAKKQLDAVNREDALLGSESCSLDCAISEAGARVQKAQAAEAQAVARQKAEEARKLVNEIAECCKYGDKHFSAAIDALIAIHNGITKLHELNFAHPTDNQVRLNVVTAIETWAMRLPKHFHNQLRDGIRFLAPHERKTLAEFWAQVQGSLDQQIASHLGETERDKAEVV